MSYWLIAVPNEKPPRDAFKTLQEASRGVCSSYEFAVPSLKVGTLDSLMGLSEELAKFDPILETLSKKIERTYFEICSQADENSQATPSAPSSSSSSSTVGRRPETEILRMGDQTTKEYVEKFKWNDFRYNSRTALKALSDSIIKEALKLDETLKKQLAEYNETRSSFAQIERVETGTLLVRPLAPYVKAADIVEGEFITTLLIVVPKSKIEEFESTYSTLEILKEKENKENADKLAKERYEQSGGEQKSTAEKEDEQKTKEIIVRRKSSATEEKKSAAEEKKEKNYKDGRTPDVEKLLSKGCPIAVPKSAKKLYDPGNNSSEEFVLYRIVVLKKAAEYYKSLLRDKRYTVRPFKYEPEEESKKNELKLELQKKKRTQWLYLQRWCNTSYVEAMVGWLHLKSIRLFVEAVLRYGLPVDFKCILIDPSRNEKKLRVLLKNLYEKLAAKNLTAALDPNEVDPSGLGEDFYPYVYLPLNIVD